MSDLHAVVLPVGVQEVEGQDQLGRVDVEGDGDIVGQWRFEYQLNNNRNTDVGSEIRNGNTKEFSWYDSSISSNLIKLAFNFQTLCNIYNVMKDGETRGKRNWWLIEDFDKKTNMLYFKQGRTKFHEIKISWSSTLAGVGAYYLLLVNKINSIIQNKQKKTVELQNCQKVTSQRILFIRS